MVLVSNNSERTTVPKHRAQDDIVNALVTRHVFGSFVSLCSIE